MRAIKPEQLKEGDLFAMNFGSEMIEFYVVENDTHSRLLYFCSRQWLSNNIESKSYSRLYTHYVPIVHLGTGKKRWWFKLIPTFLDLRYLICPYKFTVFKEMPKISFSIKTEE